MYLEIENIAKIASAKIHIKSIAVIAAENGMGKSTVSKALYGVSRMLVAQEHKILLDRRKSAESVLNPLFYGTDDSVLDQFRPLAQEVRSVFDAMVALYQRYHAETAEVREEHFKSELELLIGKKATALGLKASPKRIERLVGKLYSQMNVTDEAIVKRLMTNALKAEFGGQICNVFNDNTGKITIQNSDGKVEVKISKDEVIKVSNVDGGVELKAEPVYIDSLLDLNDNNRYYNFRWEKFNHRTSLRNKLEYIGSNETATETEARIAAVKPVLEVLNEAFQYHLELDDNQGFVVPMRAGKVINFENLSSGQKSLAVIKALIESGLIEEGSLLILDEPEIHQHPKWINIFAKTLVLLQKALDLRILINTHNPQFLLGVDVYSEIYGIAGKNRYYIAEEIKDDPSEQVQIIECEDQDRVLDNIYMALSEPALDLQRLREKVMYDADTTV